MVSFAVPAPCNGPQKCTHPSRSNGSEQLVQSSRCYQSEKSTHSSSFKRNQKASGTCCGEVQWKCRQKEVTQTWHSLPDDVHCYILSKLDYRNLAVSKAVSKQFKHQIESDGFYSWMAMQRPKEGHLTALHFAVSKRGHWECRGYDLTTGAWTRLPPFQMLPALDTTLFKAHSISAARGLICVHFSNVVVLNPLTGRFRVLPPLKHPRTPVLMQIVVELDSYKVIVAGSASAGEERLSKLTEVFDTRTSEWRVTDDVPGPGYALNEHQTGVLVNGLLYCVAFLGGEDAMRGLIAYDVHREKWLPELQCQLPSPTNLSIVHLLELDGAVAVFSEVERLPFVGTVEHRIDVLEGVESGKGQWRNVMTETKAGHEAGLQTYPEYTCVPFGDGRLCVFNTVAYSGVVYDVHSGQRVETLPWCRSPDVGFYSMNPVTFTFEPSFKGNPGTL